MAKRLTGSGCRLGWSMGSVEDGCMQVIIVEREGSFGVNVKYPILTNGNGDALFPNYFGEVICFCPV